jgi:transposase
MDLREEAAKLTLDEIAKLLSQRFELEQRAECLDKLVQDLNERLLDRERQLDWLKRQVFGARSERRALEMAPGCEQLWLGQQMLDVPEKPPEKKTTVAGYERQHRRNPVEFVDSDSRLRFTKDVPIQVIDVPNPELDGIPDDQLKEISVKSTYRLAQRSPYVVLEYRRRVVKRTDTGEILRPPAPSGVIDRSIADVSLLARMVVDKFMHHLPLYRQHQRMQQAGVVINRMTLTRLVHRVGEMLEPIYLALWSSILLSSVLTVDESPTPAGIQPAKPGSGRPGKIKRGYFWGFYGELQEVVFLFSPSRAQKVLDAALETFKGELLLTDGYIVYETFTKAVGLAHATCWAHTRRYFVEAERYEPKKIAYVLARIRALFKVEDQVPEGDLDARLQVRQEISKPIVDELFNFFKRELETTTLLPSNPFLEAVEYATNRETELRVFLDNPAVPISTNHIERAFRPPVVGRKNWMFHITEVGARYAAIFYSLIQSCVLAGVDPTVYFTDVLQRMDTHPSDDVHLLVPRLWKEHFADQPLKSDVSRSP